MKKILIIILAGVLLHPLPTKAQFGQDAAALIGFLTPYLGALEALSEASGMEISDLKKNYPAINTAHKFSGQSL